MTGMIKTGIRGLVEEDRQKRADRTVHDSARIKYKLLGFMVYF
jgi:hypothetical protein